MIHLLDIANFRVVVLRVCFLYALFDYITGVLISKMIKRSKRTRAMDEDTAAGIALPKKSNKKSIFYDAVVYVDKHLGKYRDEIRREVMSPDNVRALELGSNPSKDLVSYYVDVILYYDMLYGEMDIKEILPCAKVPPTAVRSEMFQMMNDAVQRPNAMDNFIDSWSKFVDSYVNGIMYGDNILHLLSAPLSDSIADHVWHGLLIRCASPTVYKYLQNVYRDCPIIMNPLSVMSALYGNTFAFRDIVEDGMIGQNADDDEEYMDEFQYDREGRAKHTNVRRGDVLSHEHVEADMTMRMVNTHLCNIATSISDDRGNRWDTWEIWADSETNTKTFTVVSPQGESEKYDVIRVLDHDVWVDFYSVEKAAYFLGDWNVINAQYLDLRDGTVPVAVTDMIYWPLLFYLVRTKKMPLDNYSVIDANMKQRIFRFTNLEQYSIESDLKERFLSQTILIRAAITMICMYLVDRGMTVRAMLDSFSPQELSKELLSGSKNPLFIALVATTSAEYGKDEKHLFKPRNDLGRAIVDCAVNQYVSFLQSRRNTSPLETQWGSHESIEVGVDAELDWYLKFQPMNVFEMGDGGVFVVRREAAMVGARHEILYSTMATFTKTQMKRLGAECFATYFPILKAAQHSVDPAYFKMVGDSRVFNRVFLMPNNTLDVLSRSKPVDAYYLLAQYQLEIIEKSKRWYEMESFFNHVVLPVLKFLTSRFDSSSDDMMDYDTAIRPVLHFCSILHDFVQEHRSSYLDYPGIMGPLYNDQVLEDQLRITLLKQLKAQLGGRYRDNYDMVMSRFKKVSEDYPTHYNQGVYKTQYMANAQRMFYDHAVDGRLIIENVHGEQEAFTLERYMKLESLGLFLAPHLKYFLMNGARIITDISEMRGGTVRLYYTLRLQLFRTSYRRMTRMEWYRFAMTITDEMNSLPPDRRFVKVEHCVQPHIRRVMHFGCMTPQALISNSYAIFNDIGKDSKLKNEDLPNLRYCSNVLPFFIECNTDEIKTTVKNNWYQAIRLTKNVANLRDQYIGKRDTKNFKSAMSVSIDKDLVTAFHMFDQGFLMHLEPYDLATVTIEPGLRKQKKTSYGGPVEVLTPPRVEAVLEDIMYAPLRLSEVASHWNYEKVAEKTGEIRPFVVNCIPTLPTTSVIDPWKPVSEGGQYVPPAGQAWRKGKREKRERVDESEDELYK